MVLSEGYVGEVRAAAGVPRPERMGPYSEQIVNLAGSGILFEACRNGRLFHATHTAVAPNAATFGGVLAATSTPVLAIVNTIGSGKAAVILRAGLAWNPAAATALAGVMWGVASNSATITTAAANATASCGRLDAPTATVMKLYSNVALTGLTNGATARPWTSSIAVNQTALIASQFQDETEGSIIVTPGAVAAVMFSATPAASGTAITGITYIEVDWPL